MSKRFSGSASGRVGQRLKPGLGRHWLNFEAAHIPVIVSLARQSGITVLSRRLMSGDALELRCSWDGGAKAKAVHGYSAQW